MQYVVVLAIVFPVNLLPAFGPPTWALLVLFKLNWDLQPVLLVAAGAVGAGLGRYVLGWASFRLRSHLGARRRKNLEAAASMLGGHRAKSIAGLGFFALSPVPSAQLFVAAGVLGLPLLPLTAAFFAGRLVSYSLYVSAASAAAHSYGDLIRASFTSPWGIAVQVLLLAGVVGLAQVDWQRILDRRAGHRTADSSAP